MGTQLRRGCWQLALCTRCLYPTNQRQICVSRRKLSAVCSPVSQISDIANVDENITVDEFEENSLYEYPVDVPDQTRPLIHEIMETAEIHSRFHFKGVPKNLSPDHWKGLLERDPMKRLNYLTFLYWKEKVKEVRKKQALERRLVRGDKVSIPKFSTGDVVPYFHTRNSIFSFIFLRDFMKRNEFLRVMRSAIVGPHIIIDCSYESRMVHTEITSCVRQIAMLRNDNKDSLRPFNIIHCNVNMNGVLIEKLKKEFVPDCLDPCSTFHFTEKHFVDLFPVEKLVYLSPHSDTELETYDHDSIYVVGALVDHIPKVGLSVETADLAGIRTAKFPLEKYINWCQGTKCLMLVQAVNIMHDLKEGHSWDKILRRHIQPEKTTHATQYWKHKTNTDRLSSGYIDHLNNKTHYMNDIGIKS